MAKSFSCKLLQKPHISVEEQLNIVNAVFQNRDALNPHAEGEPTNFFGIVINESINIRIHHAASQQLNPAAGLAVATGTPITVSAASAKDAANLHIRTGFGEGKERRIKPRL